MLFCIIGVSFLVVMIVIARTYDIIETDYPFYASLTSKQQQIYQSIKAERFSLLVNSAHIGLCVGLIILYLVNTKDAKREWSGSVLLGCAFTAQYLWYAHSPKRRWSEVGVTLPQYSKWKKLRGMFRYRHAITWDIGMMGYFILGYGIAPQLRIV